MYSTWKIRIDIFFILVVFLLLFETIINLFIPSIQQVKPFFSYLILTLLPGYLIYRLFKTDKVSFWEKVIICVGLSLSFLIFFGLVTNISLAALGVKKPLKPNIVVLSINIGILILLILSYFKNKEPINIRLPKLNIIDKVLLILPIVCIPLSILGKYTNRSSLIVLFCLIILNIIIMFFHKENLSEHTTITILFLISISIILTISFFSTHIYGYDTHSEYYFFRQVYDNNYWKVYENNILDSSLAISLLPTVYQSFLNIDIEQLFKCIYILPLALTPLCVYFISRRYLETFPSFLSALVLVSQYGFFFQTSAYRTFLAIFYFALFLYILLVQRFNNTTIKGLLIVFFASGVVTHYTVTFIGFIVIFLTGLLLQLGSKININRKPKHVSALLLVLFFVIIFFWHSQMTGSVFDLAVNFVKNTINMISSFFISDLRDPAVKAALGGKLGPSFLSYFNFCISWLSIIFIAIGVLTNVINLLARNKYSSNNALPCGFGSEFTVLAFVCSIVFAAAVALPYVFVGYSLTRAYYQMMVVLAPFFISGGVLFVKLLRFIKVKNAYAIILFVLISCFMNNSGLLHQLFGYKYSNILNPPQVTHDFNYLYDSEVYGAKWLGSTADYKNKLIYGDYASRARLVSAGLIYRNYTNPNINNVKDGYIYLRYDNIHNNMLHLYDPEKVEWGVYRIKSYKELLSGSCIYNNGGSQIWDNYNKLSFNT